MLLVMQKYWFVIGKSIMIAPAPYAGFMDGTRILVNILCPEVSRIYSYI